MTRAVNVTASLKKIKIKKCTKQLIKSENNDIIHFSYLAHAFFFFFQASQANMHVTGEKKRRLAHNN